VDELLTLVAEKAGISTDKAKTAIDTIIGYLKDKLPGPLGSQLDSFTSGSPKTMDSANIMDGMKGLFGKKD
jgi:hypothetical protein